MSPSGAEKMLWVEVVNLTEDRELRPLQGLLRYLNLRLKLLIVQYALIVQLGQAFDTKLVLFICLSQCLDAGQLIARHGADQEARAATCQR